MTYLFVGERPSETAKRMGVTWKDGRLAAKQLFDALATSGIDPHSQRYDNIFKFNEDVVCPKALRRIRQATNRGLIVVAMGSKVQGVLSSKGIRFFPIVHPAARGHIRKKERYAEHVRISLTNTPAM